MPLLVSLTSHTGHVILPLIGRRLDGKSASYRRTNLILRRFVVDGSRFELFSNCGLQGRDWFADKSTGNLVARNVPSGRNPERFVPVPVARNGVEARRAKTTTRREIWKNMVTAEPVLSTDVNSPSRVAKKSRFFGRVIWFQRALQVQSGPTQHRGIEPLQKSRCRSSQNSRKRDDQFGVSARPALRRRSNRHLVEPSRGPCA